MSKRFLVFGAHPDDPDLMFGGSALKLIRAGHHVKFVSLTDGSAGHQSMEPSALAARRYEEAQETARRGGLDEYEVMKNPDGRLMNTLENREEITRIIRRYQPDVVITHRLCDYHPDHRTTSQLVLDTSFMLRVPHFCPDVQVPENNPVFAHSFDSFTDPRPLRVDAFVDITPVMEDKLRLLDSHVSQFYEWLPWVNWNMKDFDASGWDWEKRRAWLDERWGCRFALEAELIPGKTGGRAEVFEYSPYGRNVDMDAFQALFEP